MLLTAPVKAENFAQTDYVSESIECQVIDAAIQYQSQAHAEKQHCISAEGLFFELAGLPSDFDEKYRFSLNLINIRLDARKYQVKIPSKAEYNRSAKEIKRDLTELKHQLKNISKPTFTVNNFYRSQDKITLTQDSKWSISEAFSSIDAAAAAVESAELAVDFAEMAEKKEEASEISVAQNAIYDNTATMLVVHVTANDFSTTASPSALGDSVFGTLGDMFNLSSQFDACSYGTKKFVPAQGANIVDGVVQLTIGINVNGVSDGTVKNAVTTAGNALFGDISAQADHVMYALPSNTSGSWIAYAYVDSWLSVYNDNWATYLSAQMHEVGHNLEMGHSNEGGNEYADQSGMMGYSYSQDDSPVMCFNAAKSSKFSWYSDKELSLDNESWNGKVIGLADYDVAAIDHNVLLKIRSEDGNNDAKTLNITYNRKIGINSGTKEAGDKIMVVESATPTNYNVTSLLAKLSTGESYTYANFWGAGKDFTITIDNIGTDADSVEYAMVSVSNGEVIPEFELTVTNGIGDGTYTVGSVVNITADEPLSGQEFVQWVIESGSAIVSSPVLANTTLVMGSEDSRILATYRNLYQLTVNNGSGNGSYAEGAGVAISADTPPNLQEFDKWVTDSETAIIASPTSADTILTMGAEAASITATYQPMPVLTVKNGSGDGSYTEGSEVDIIANAPASFQEFDKWIVESGTAVIASKSNAITTIITGEIDTSITATYRNLNALIVNNGTGDGHYSEHTNLIITANPAPNGQEFHQWLISSGSANIASTSSISTTLSMGAGSVTVTATYRNVYTLTVLGGEGSGIYTDGIYVTIIADSSSNEQIFDQWMVSSGSAIIASPISFNTTIITGPANTTVMATYSKVFALAIENGLGTGIFVVETEVEITANTAPSSQEFDQWLVTSGTATVSSATSLNTTIILSSEGATITATYRDIPILTINSGLGGGSYTTGTEVNITANAAPSGQIFEKWLITSGVATLASSTSASTTLTTDSVNATVTATYSNIPTTETGNSDDSGGGSVGFMLLILVLLIMKSKRFQLKATDKFLV